MSLNKLGSDWDNDMNLRSCSIQSLDKLPVTTNNAVHITYPVAYFTSRSPSIFIQQGKEWSCRTRLCNLTFVMFLIAWAGAYSDIVEESIEIASQTKTHATMGVDPKFDKPSMSWSGCLNSVDDPEYVSALGQEWHTDCFRCSACDAKLPSWYSEKDSMLFCRDDYWMKCGESCQQCGEGITGPVMVAGDHKFHPECFCCCPCKAFIGDGESYASAERSKLFCGRCYRRQMNPLSKASTNSESEGSLLNNNKPLHSIRLMEIPWKKGSKSGLRLSLDEIQWLRDPGRGWVWTRAFLGLVAEEVHVCGEPEGYELLQRICETIGEMKSYKRLAELSVEDAALVTLDNIVPGDRIVCFSKNDTYSVARDFEARGVEVAIIYGDLSPGTKLAQAAKFNEPINSFKVMVATDAIGMGLNLSIRCIIFYSLVKPTMNEKGKRGIDIISVSQALQIAGHAGRYGTQWEHGYVTSFRLEDLPVLKDMLNQTPESSTQAGLHPTAGRIELYAGHLPNSTLTNLMDIFVSLSSVDDSLHFMCSMEDFKVRAETIQRVPSPRRARHVFCCAPINRKRPVVCSMLLNRMMAVSPVMYAIRTALALVNLNLSSSPGNHGDDGARDVAEDRGGEKHKARGSVLEFSASRTDIECYELREKQEKRKRDFVASVC